VDPTQRAKLEEMAAEHKRLLDELGSPEVAADHQRYSKIARRVADLDDVVRTYHDYLEAIGERAEAEELLHETQRDEERDFYRETIDQAQSRADALEARIHEFLVPRDPRDDRAVIFEIRAGAGGDEAALFAGELMRAYQRYAERKGWKTDVLDISEGAVGGLKEVVFEVDGKGAFSALRHESGVHRVQRVPATESSGRIHTSTVTVAVLPEADEVEVEIDGEDLEIDTYRAQGAGGQHVNTTDSAVRITHKPTGLVVTCQSERSQRQNRDRAMRILLARLKALAEEEAHSQLAAERKSQVGTGDRSEKIRTYNFPQNRVTDHRVGVTVHGIQQIMDGDLDPIVEPLKQLELEVAAN